MEGEQRIRELELALHDVLMCFSDEDFIITKERLETWSAVYHGEYNGSFEL